MSATAVLHTGDLAQRLAEAQATIAALLSGEIDAVVDSRTSTPVLLSKAQDALRESEERYRLMFEYSPLPMWVFDIKSLAFLAVNEAAARHYGYSQKEFLKMTLKDIRAAEEVPVLIGALGGPDVVERIRGRHRKKDGSMIDVEISAHAFSLGGKSAKLVLANDVTARERALEALRSSEVRFARLLDAGIIGIIVADNAGNVIEANDAFLQMVGYSREDLRAGKVCWADLTPEQWRPLHREVGQQLAAAGIARPFEKEYFRKDGSRIPVLVGIAKLNETSSISVVLDISERKRLETVRRETFELEMQNRRIQEASRLKSEFLANMSHELRTPLNAILGFGELLYDGMVLPDSPLHRQFLGDIIKSGRHLLQLINDVLDLAKVEAGKLDFRPEAIDLEVVLAEVMSIVHAISGAKKIRIEGSIDAELKKGIFLDPARLKQILYNLISNALKFTPAGGAVTVRVRPHGVESLILEVEDTGSGIAPEDIERLFIEFQQLEEGTAKKHGGTGLGLALTRRLAEAQGGSVGVRSTLGKGSVFHVVLPRRSPARAT